MIEERTIRSILAQQSQEAQQVPLESLCSRKEEALLELSSSQAQIVIGVRRSGKSTMCHRFLRSHQIDYAYVNFDDDRLTDFGNEDWDTMLTSLTILYGDFSYLFLDEPQNVPTWHLFVNRMLRQRVHVFLTGSNAKLLSGELSTHLTGRYNQVELYPLSFSEYLDLRGISSEPLLISDKAALQVAFENYLEQGGLPETLQHKRWKNYLSTIFSSIITRDIVQRFRVRYPEALNDIALQLLDNFAREVNYEGLSKMVGATTDKTVRKYVSYLSQAYLFVPLHKFSFKSRVRMRGSKLYVVDNGFASAINEMKDTDMGWKLENIVFLELLRRSYDNPYKVYYHKSAYEIDFVIVRGRKVSELIQVSVSLSNDKTRQREFSALVAGADDLHCGNLTIITLDSSSHTQYKGHEINVCNAVEWLIKT